MKSSKNRFVEGGKDDPETIESYCKNPEGKVQQENLQWLVRFQYCI
jgi:hypothetical protein